MATRRPKDRERDFTMEDNLLIQKAKTLCASFSDHIAPFTAFDSEFDATYTDNWKLAIEDAEACPTDETVKDILSQHTQELAKAKDEGFIAASDLEYYTGKAYPGKKRIMEEFGFTERKKARAAQFNQLMWLRVMKKIADDHLTPLNAAGMPATLLPNLETKTANILEKETMQEYYKHVRIRLVRERIDKHNKVYEFCTRTSEVAKLIFRNNNALYTMFNIY